MNDSLEPSAPEPLPPADPTEIPCVDSRELMRGHREITIIHNGQRYRLSITRNEKLILQK